jgi:hypothetical protein
MGNPIYNNIYGMKIFIPIGDIDPDDGAVSIIPEEDGTRTIYIDYYGEGDGEYYPNFTKEVADTFWEDFKAYQARIEP